MEADCISPARRDNQLMLLRALSILVLLIPASVYAQDCEAIRLVTVTVQPSSFPSLPGQSVTFRVFVQPVQNVAWEPTGEVQMFEGPTEIGTYPLKQAQTALTRTFFESGAHVLRAVYSGDLTYCQVTAFFGQQVDHLTPAIALTANGNTLTARITATVPSGVAAPAGPVQFLEGATVLGTATLVNGAASLTLSNLTPGAHQISAVLIGDSVWYQVRSAPVTVTAVRADTTTSLSASAGISTSTLTAVVTPAADGAVQFVDTTTQAVLGSINLPATNLTLPASQILASVGHGIVAMYSGSARFSPSTSIAIEIPAAVNSASGVVGDVAPEEIVSLYGWNLAARPVQAGFVPLPVSLDGYRVNITDSAGTERQAALYFISPKQFNFVMPQATTPGIAVISVGAPGLRPPITPIRVNVAPVSPGIYVAVVSADRTYLVLYGTGIRNRTSLAGVTCTVGGQAATVLYAGPQPESPGLDQVNVLIPAGLTGEVTVTLSVDGQTANAVTAKL
jgi:uncharacterized protein (TIGR03437 family)